MPPRLSVHPVSHPLVLRGGRKSGSEACTRNLKLETRNFCACHSQAARTDLSNAHKSPSLPPSAKPQTRPCCPVLGSAQRHKQDVPVLQLWVRGLVDQDLLSANCVSVRPPGVFRNRIPFDLAVRFMPCASASACNTVTGVLALDHVPARLTDVADHIHHSRPQHDDAVPGCTSRSFSNASPRAPARFTVTTSHGGALCVMLTNFEAYGVRPRRRYEVQHAMLSS